MISRKKIFIHIGYPKTATTTLQKHIFPIMEDISYLGKFYDKNNKDSFVIDKKIINAIFLQNELTFRLKLPEYQAIINPLVTGDCLLSEEAFLGYSLNPISNNDIFFNSVCPFSVARKLKWLFDEKRFDVNIIITIRKQDEFILSKYAQSYRDFYLYYKQTSSFSKFLDLFLKYDTNKFKNILHYDVIDNYFCEVFGENNIHFLAYESFHETPSRFIDSLSKITGKKISTDNLNFLKKENVRNTPNGYKTPKPVTLYHLINFTYRRLISNHNIKLENKYKILLLKTKLFENFNKDIFLTAVQRKKILDIYENSNTKISDKYNLNLQHFGYYN